MRLARRWYDIVGFAGVDIRCDAVSGCVASLVFVALGEETQEGHEQVGKEGAVDSGDGEKTAGGDDKRCGRG